MIHDLADELGTRETAALEFKSEVRDRNAIRKAICALANDLCGKGGGDLIVGVSDDGTPLDGVDVSDKALLGISDIRDEGKILDLPSMTVEVAVYAGKPVVRVHVAASHTPPVRLDGVVWVRPGPTTRRASADDERRLTEHRRAFTQPFDSHPVLGSSIDELDRRLFESTYLPAAVDPSVLEENHRPLEAQMASLRITGPNDVPTVLGHLLIGFDPARYLPGAYLQFVRLRGVDMDAPVIDEQELRLNIIEGAERLEAVLRGHLHTRIVETGGFREQATPDYPFDALREVCMNAVMHRNYESSNAPIRVLWFDDRIEVSNPGGPYGQVNAENYDRFNDYRNPVLAGAMKSLGYVNRFGRGIRRIRAALEQNGNPSADFDIDDTSWTVTMRSMA